ncbi:Autophagy-related protein 17 [Grifola frondosa]|uniref:Autophagy-related protein 17 n=1 Tax=Grifola frondosa TaxID=5627 RepID=A0A1C7M6E7_GRIFR|nr:Autophagy-related protein 17 [Grifola frondosa]
MATSPTTGPSTGTVQAHVSSLVAKSQQALQHGELLCLRASELSASSAQSAADMLALDAKVRWITNAVLEQLQLAAHVAKSIEQKRSLLEKQVEEWETLRNQRADALDAILESLGTQVVPPEFHSSSPDSSPFGSQQNSDGEHEDGAPFGDPDPQPGQSPTETLHRTRWKTLRDFVDERAIEDVLDTIESDHNALDDVLARTADYPESLSSTISVIRRTVPVELPLPSVEDIFSSQETARTKMAGQLESLVQHLGEMEGALKDILAGEEFDDEDLQAMNRDTEELPVIVTELEESMASINASHEQLTVAKRLAQEHLDTHRRTLDDLDELGDIMYEMLERQEAVETESTEHLVVLHHHLVTIDDLHHRFTSYQYSYNRLVLELARRRQYREAAQKIVEGMLAQLDAMTEEERQAREEFSAEYGQYLPRTCVSAYRMHPHGDIDGDLLEEARRQVTGVEHGLGASQSL